MLKWLMAFLPLSFTGFTQVPNAQYRTVYIFYADDTRALFDQQLNWLTANKKGCEERDIRIISMEIQSASKDELDKFLITEKFTFILEGKDGGEKYRSSKPVLAEELFVIIDAMPMRKIEMKRKRRNLY